MLKLQEIKKLYSSHSGITKVSLTLFPGKLYLFLGKNGSGKSTTIKLISKIIFHHPKDGIMENTFQKVIYLPDKRSYPKLLETKTFLQYYLGSESSIKAIETAMEEYQLPNKPIGALSKGMLQKLGILQAILSQGDLYLLDEPTDGLDQDSIKRLKLSLTQMLEAGKTIVISTHSRQLFKEIKPIYITFKDGICE